MNYLNQNILCIDSLCNKTRKTMYVTRYKTQDYIIPSFISFLFNKNTKLSRVRAVPSFCYNHNIKHIECVLKTLTHSKYTL